MLVWARQGFLHRKTNHAFGRMPQNWNWPTRPGSPAATAALTASS